MFKQIIVAALISVSIPAQAQTVAQPEQDGVNRGPCPSAYIDYDYYHRKYRDPDYVPVQVQVYARKALNACAKAGIKVPYTVAEYNGRARELVDAREVLRYAHPLYTGEESVVRP